MNMQCGMAKAPAGQVLASYRYLVRTLPRYSVACLWKDHTVDQAFLEDLAPGQVFTSDARAVVDAGAIKRFASEFDPQPFHLDEASARPTFFKKLVASGWHTTAVTMQLLVRTLPLSHGIIGSGVDELRWPRGAGRRWPTHSPERRSTSLRLRPEEPHDQQNIALRHRAHGCAGSPAAARRRQGQGQGRLHRPAHRRDRG